MLYNAQTIISSALIHLTIMLDDCLIDLFAQKETVTDGLMASKIFHFQLGSPAETLKILKWIPRGPKS